MVSSVSNQPMSESAVKAARRDLRRAMGAQGVSAIAEVQRNIAALSNSLANGHQRIDDAQQQRERDLGELKKRLLVYERAQLDAATFLGPGLLGRIGLVGRMCRWVFTGRAWRK